MKKWIGMVVAALIVPQLVGAEAQVEKAPEALPFVSGERLRYDVSLLGVRAGQAELRVERSTTGEWRLHATGQTVGASDSLFGLRQTASCTVDGDDLSPRTCLFTSKQRSSMRRREMRFDEASGEVRERLLADGKRTEKTHRFEETGDIQDALSGFYLMRKELPAMGETVRFRSLRKGKPLTVEGTVVGEEEITTPAGTFRTFVVELRVLEKLDADAAQRGKVWITSDERRLPVRVSLDAPVGSLVASLTAATGTRDGSVAGR